MPALGAELAFPLGDFVGTISNEDALDLLVQLLPEGAAKLYGILNKSGDPYEFYAAIADAFKTYCYDQIDILRGENNPLTAIYRVTDYEAVLGLSASATALTGTLQQRRNAIVSKLRESGAFTLANIRAIIAPLLGYANASDLQVIESDRAAQTAAHTYTATGGAIGANTSLSVSIVVNDDGGLSSAGLQLQLPITSTNPEQLSVSVTGPTTGTGSGQIVLNFTAGSFPAGAVTANVFQLNDLTSKGKWITGTWTVRVWTGAAVCTLGTVSLFAEGCGQRDSGGYDGLGASQFKFLVYADAAKMGVSGAASLEAARGALKRIQPAYALGTVVSNASAQPSASLFPPFVPRST